MIGLNNILQHGEIRTFKAGDRVPWWVILVLPYKKRWLRPWTWGGCPHFLADAEVSWRDFNAGNLNLCFRTIPIVDAKHKWKNHYKVRGGVSGRAAVGSQPTTSWEYTGNPGYWNGACDENIIMGTLLSLLPPQLQSSQGA